jgi:hypothetical protein
VSILHLAHFFALLLRTPECRTEVEFRRDAIISEAGLEQWGVLTAVTCYRVSNHFPCRLFTYRREGYIYFALFTDIRDRCFPHFAVSWCDPKKE